MRASERLQEQKDVALASSKIAIEKAGKELPTQAELNISNKVSELSSITGGGGNLFSSISGGFKSLLSNALGSISSLSQFNPSGLIDSTNISNLFESASSSIDSLVDSVKQEEIDNRVDYQATKTEPFIDDNGVTTYYSLELLRADVSSKKYAEEKVLKLDSTRAYYVVRNVSSVFLIITLFNHNLERKRKQLDPLVPKGAVERDQIAGVKIFEGPVKKV